MSSIRIDRKPLPSGNEQVKFFIEDENHPRYGYLLVQGPRTVGEIIQEIQQRMARRNAAIQKHHGLALKPEEKDDHCFYLYSA